MKFDILASKTTGGFYNLEVHGNSIPKDAVPISDTLYLSLLEGNSQGRPIHFDDLGVPFLGLVGEVTKEQSVVMGRLWRDSELSRADIELYKVQDSDPRATSTVSEWRAYRKMLRAWPEDANFPSEASRPKAPDLNN